MSNQARLAASEYINDFFFEHKMLEPYSSAATIDKPEDKRYFTKLAKGVIRNYSLLKWHITRFLDPNKPLPGLVEASLISGTYQLFFMNRTPSYSIINDTVEIVKQSSYKKFSGLVNAVLRRIDRESLRSLVWLRTVGDLKDAERISVLYSHPLWLVEKWIEEFGIENAEKYCHFNQQDYPHFIRPNNLKSNLETLENFLKEHKIDFETIPYLPGVFSLKSGIQDILNSDEWKEGNFIIQDETSIVTGKIVAESASGTYIDICGAPGLKTQLVIEKLGEQARGIVNELDLERFNEMKENFINWGIFSLGLYNIDAVTLPQDLSGTFDTILLDAPCSNLGVLASRPDLRWKRTLMDIKNISKLQLELLTSAGKLCRWRGSIFYITCSIEEEETDLLINQFLKENRSFYPDEIESIVPEPFKKFIYNNRLKILPFEIQKTGFYLVKLTKRRGAT